ncbi:MAG: HD domain-containing protein [Polyangiaceae bacterium]
MSKAELLMRAGGRLSAFGRFRRVLAGSMARAGVWATPRVASRELARAAAATRPPSSVALRNAESLVDQVCPPWLAGHCRRTWSWAAALGEVTGTRCDRELLYLAALFHDLGLSEAYAPPPGECFAVTGARAARAWAIEAGFGDARARRVAEAIALHLEVRVAVVEGVEAHLLHAGAACDVLGARLRQLPPALVDEVLALYPRGEMSSALAESLRKQAEQAPDSRIGLYCRRFDFARRAATTTLGRAP